MTERTGPSRALWIAIAAAALVQAAVLTVGWGYWRLGDAGRRTHDLADVLDPGGGGGQLLGIAGYGLVLLLLLYSVRKLLARASWLPAPRSFLAVHVLAGTLAPLFVLEHCGFRFDGLPGVAAILLLIVSTTGFAGRWLVGRLPARADLERRRADVPTRLILRASAGGDPSRPAAPDRSVVQALGSLAEIPLAAGHPWLLPGYELRAARALGVIRRSLETADLPHRLRTAIQGELAAAVRARRAFVRVESARRIARWWHIAHVSLSHAMIVLATLHVGLALTYSGTADKIRALLLGS